MLKHWLVWVLFCLGLLSGCDSRDETGPAQGRTSLAVWAHAGQEAERRTLQEQVQRFNAGQDSITVELTFIPERAYNAQVQAAALAGDLPDVLEFDGPYLYSYAWQGHLRAIGDLLPDPLQQDLLPSIINQGTYHDRLYSVGTFDSGLGLYGRRSRLQASGIRIPTSPEDAWSIAEFDSLMAWLAKGDPDGAVLDLKLNYPGEWLTYAFAPVIQSAGGDLIRRDDFLSAAGVLDGPASIAAMQQLQSWIARGYVDPNVDDGAFISGRVALSWVGHWEYPRYREQFQEDLVVLPLPDFGKGMRTGMGSWNWGVTRECRSPQAAARFLSFLLQTEEVLAMASSNGAVPATRSAIGLSPLYGPDGPLKLFTLQLLQGYAIPRPQTPAYPIISSAFQEAFRAIRNGAPVEPTLKHAVVVIDQEIRDNRGYPLQGGQEPR